MKTVILIYFYVAILPLIVVRGNAKLREQLEEIANKNGNIEGMFQPANGGYLGRGAFGLTFKGTLLKPIQMEVAMKFTSLKHGIAAEKEYEAYSYLDAINNTDVERYGIPTVYYYGTWDDYVMIAITLMDSKYEKMRDLQKLTDVDILILAREFVKISKYIHSRGVYHCDIKLENIMFRKHKAYIIDFNMASKLYRMDTFREFGIPPRDVFEDRRRCALEDWSAFSIAVCHYIGVHYDWFDKRALYKLRNGDPNECSSLKNDIPHQNNQFNKEELMEVFVEFLSYKRKLADCYQDTTRFQLYDELYHIINVQIDKFQLPKPVLVSWLTDEDKEIAKVELGKKQLPDISSINDCFANVHADYPKVNFKYFDEMNQENIIFEASEHTQIDPEGEPTTSSSATSTSKRINKSISSRIFRCMGIQKKQ